MPLNCTVSDGFSPASSNADLTKPTVSFRAGLLVFALYSHNAESETDLSIVEGEELKIVDLHPDPTWATAVNRANQRGMINLSQVASVEASDSHRSYPWFHGTVTRSDTELRLTPRNINGLFLVRESNNHPGDLTLSVVFDGQIRHYHIRCLELSSSPLRRCYAINDSEGRYYPLSELVRHYAMDADDLICQLTQPAIAPPPAAQTKSSARQQSPKYKPAVPAATPDSDALVMRELLGKGEFGEVFKASFRGKLVAVKCLQSGADPGTQAAFDEEARLMKTLNHPNLVRYVDSMCRNGKQLLITEFLSLGSLLNYLRSRGQSVISGSDQLNFALNVASGMKYLADCRLVHRDLAARNVLLDANCTAKIADFGLTITCPGEIDSFDQMRIAAASKQQQQQQPGQKSAADRIPIKWTAPECVSNRSQFSFKSDVWSYGVLLWEIYSFGRLPYPRVSTDQVHAKLLSGYRMESPDKCPGDVYRLMRDCWELKPVLRPAFAEIIDRLVKISTGA